MKNLLLLLLILPLTLFSLQSCGPDPVKYNDETMGYFNEINKQSQEYINQLKKILQTDISTALANNDYETLKTKAKHTTQQIDQLVEKINQLEQPKDAKEFHQSIIKYANTVNKYINTTAEQFSKITETTTTEEFKTMNSISQKVYTEEVTTTYQSMKKEQQKFATTNGAKLR